MSSRGIASAERSELASQREQDRELQARGRAGVSPKNAPAEVGYTVGKEFKIEHIKPVVS